MLRDVLRLTVNRDHGSLTDDVHNVRIPQSTPPIPCAGLYEHVRAALMQQLGVEEQVSRRLQDVVTHPLDRPALTLPIGAVEVIDNILSRPLLYVLPDRNHVRSLPMREGTHR